jgi:hypothetical protein
MDPREALERQITENLESLHAVIDRSSTESVLGWCFNQSAMALKLTDEKRLASPAKQIPFLIGILLAQSEPKEPGSLDQKEWERVKGILDKLFSSYILLYAPPKDKLGALSEEWYRVREVSMLAFLHFFNTGLFASGGVVNRCVKRFRRLSLSARSSCVQQFRP